MKGYYCYLLSESNRKTILEKFEPYFDKVILHHVTEAFNVDSSYECPEKVKCTISGYCINDDIECFTVEIDGKKTSSDNRCYHITFSHSDRAKPVDSNTCITEENIFTITPIEMDLYRKFIPFKS
jgi:hypothetical protein